MQKRQDMPLPLKLLVTEWMPYPDFLVAMDLSNVKQMPAILRRHPDLLVTYVPHCHDWHEIEVVTSGSAIHHVNGHAFPVSAGDVHVLRPGMVHYFSQPRDFRACDIHFVLEGLPLPKELLEAMPSYPRLMFGKGQADTIGDVHLDSDELMVLFRMVMQLGDELRYQHDGFKARTIALLTEALVLLCRLHARQHGHQRSPVAERVEKARLFMKLNARHHLGVEDVAGHVSVSPRTLQRDFLQTLGMTPMDCLHQLRLLDAASLLVLTDERPITDICFTVGFGSVVYFCQAFKRHFGCTPSEYRAKNHLHDGAGT